LDSDLSVNSAVGGSALNGAASSAALTNQEGRIVGGHNVTLDVTALTGQGQLLSGGEMRVTTHQDLTNTSRIEANGNLEWTNSGNIINQGVLNAAGSLHIAGKDVTNTEAGEITSGAITEVTASGQLTNRGLIDGVDTRINADTVDNAGMGRIYGDRISIAATTLHNYDDNGTSGTIASRGNLDIGVQQLINENGALLYSDGSMAIAGALDANRNSTDRGTLLRNSAATIEAGQRLAIGLGPFR